MDKEPPEEEWYWTPPPFFGTVLLWCIAAWLMLALVGWRLWTWLA